MSAVADGLTLLVAGVVLRALALGCNAVLPRGTRDQDEL